MNSRRCGMALVAAFLAHVAVIPVSGFPTRAVAAPRGENPLLEWLGRQEAFFQLHPELVGEEGTGYNPYMRTRWFTDQRMVGGRLPNEDARLQVWERIRTSAAASGPYRFSLGPANFGGRVLSMTFDPNNANIIYAGTAGGGLFRTQDRGLSWVPLTDGYPFLAIGGVAVHPANSNLVMVATGQGQGGSIPISGVGIWRSTDHGSTWTQRVYGIQKQGTNPGIYRSTNNGLTWTNMFTTTSADQGRVTISPSDPTIV